MLSGIAAGQDNVKTYETTNVAGYCEAIHIGGRTKQVKVTKAFVTTNSNGFIVDAEIQQPLIDGYQNKNFFFPRIEGKASTKFPENIQILTKKEIFGNKNGVYNRVTTAIITLDDTKKPISLYVSQVDYNTSGRHFRKLDFQAGFKK